MSEQQRPIIRPAGDSDHLVWDAYVNQHPQSTFFHLFGWRTILAQVFGHEGHYLLAEAAGRVVGVLPLARQRSLLFGDALISTPFCVYGGVVADSEEIVTALESHAVQLARSLRVDHLSVRRSGPAGPGWLADDLYCAFQRPLHQDPQANLLAIPRKQRAEVRRAMGHQLVTFEETEVEQCYRLFAHSQHRLGTPVLTGRLFHALKATFKEQCHILTLARGQEVVASVMSFFFRDCVLPYYAGGGQRCRDLSGYPFLYWSLMNVAASRGCHHFDFGRSKRGSGSFAFKVNFGFEPRPLGYRTLPVRVPGLPGHNPSNPKYRMFIALWQRLPLTVANRLGPLLSSGLG